MYAGKNPNLSELLRIFEGLRPELQEYAIQQMEGLEALQEKIK